MQEWTLTDLPGLLDKAIHALDLIHFRGFDSPFAERNADFREHLEKRLLVHEKT
jgi:hypothetical protein